MPKNTASDQLVTKARQEAAKCAKYLRRHFAVPNSATERSATKLAEKTVRELIRASDRKDADEIRKLQESLGKVMVYLWAVRQFPERGTEHDPEN